MQFQVPQFIEVEDKIFGPLTFKQFVYVLGGLGAAYIVYRILPIYLALPFVVVFVGFGAALAFFKYNGRPFIVAVESAFYYYIRTRLYLWNNNRAKKPMRVENTAKAAEQDGLYIPKLSDSKLHELSWSLDIKERIAAGINPQQDKRTNSDIDVMSPIKTARQARV